MGGSIVCGVDDSESAAKAARVARVLACQLGLHLVFVRVVEPAMRAAHVSAVAGRLEELSADTSDVDCGATWRVETGDAVDRLVAAAEDVDAAFMVVGATRPDSSRRRSVSAGVTRRAPCPVVVVPLDADTRRNGHAGEPREEQDGLVRFGLRRSGIDSAGGIVRFGLGARTLDRDVSDSLLRWEWEGGAVLEDEPDAVVETSSSQGAA